MTLTADTRDIIMQEPTSHLSLLHPPVNHWVEAFNAHNIAAIVSLYTEDAELFDSGMKHPRRGRDEPFLREVGEARRADRRAHLLGGRVRRDHRVLGDTGRAWGRRALARIRGPVPRSDGTG